MAKTDLREVMSRTQQLIDMPRQHLKSVWLESRQDGVKYSKFNAYSNGEIVTLIIESEWELL